MLPHMYKNFDLDLAGSGSVENCKLNDFAKVSQVSSIFFIADLLGIGRIRISAYPASPTQKPHMGQPRSNCLNCFIGSSRLTEKTLENNTKPWWVPLVMDTE